MGKGALNYIKGFAKEMPSKYPSFSITNSKTGPSLYEACKCSINNGFSSLSLVDIAEVKKDKDIPSKGKGETAKTDNKTGKVVDKNSSKRLTKVQQTSLADFIQHLEVMADMVQGNNKTIEDLIDYIINQVGYGGYLKKQIESEQKRQDSKKDKEIKEPHKPVRQIPSAT